MADVSPKQLNPEEQAAMDAAKRDLEASKAQIGRPVELYDPLWLLTEPGQQVLSASLGRDPVTRQPYPVTTDKVTAIVPKAVKLTLTHHHVFDLQPGIRELPAALMNHPFMRANGVKAYERAPNPTSPPPILMGTGRLRDPVRVGDRDYPLGNWVVQAFTVSGMDAAAWNALTDEARTALIQAEIEKAEAASRVEIRTRAEDEAWRENRTIPLREAPRSDLERQMQQEADELSEQHRREVAREPRLEDRRGDPLGLSGPGAAYAPATQTRTETPAKPPPAGRTQEQIAAERAAAGAADRDARLAAEKIAADRVAAEKAVADKAAADKAAADRERNGRK